MVNLLENSVVIGLFRLPLDLLKSIVTLANAA